MIQTKFQKYFVDEDGNVYSTQKGYIRRLKPFLAGSTVKYPQVTICHGGKKSKVYVHHLMLETFIGACPLGMETRHLDGNPVNNRINNLCWGTHQENVADSIKHGTFLKGEVHPNAKLTSDAIKKIKYLRCLGYTYHRIALKYGVCMETISRVVNCHSYADVA